mgnify:CR=1 FL=1
MKEIYINWPVIELSGDIYKEEVLPKIKFAIENELRNPEWHKKLDIIAKEVFDRVLENIKNEENISRVIEKFTEINSLKK